MVKNLSAKEEFKKHGFNTRSGRSPGEGSGNPLQCSCLENPTDREAWWAIVNGVAKRHDWACTHTEVLRVKCS